MTEIQRPPLAVVPNTPPRPTSWQQNAASFATTPEQAIDAERHRGVRRALGYLTQEQPSRGRAFYELSRSVIRQARIAGLGTLDLQPACPCGGRCHQ